VSTVWTVERALLVRMATGAARAQALAQLVLQEPGAPLEQADVIPVLKVAMATTALSTQTRTVPGPVQLAIGALQAPL